MRIQCLPRYAFLCCDDDKTRALLSSSTWIQSWEGVAATSASRTLPLSLFLPPALPARTRRFALSATPSSQPCQHPSVDIFNTDPRKDKSPEGQDHLEVVVWLLLPGTVTGARYRSSCFVNSGHKTSATPRPHRDEYHSWLPS